MEQRAHGFEVWSQPLVTLRLSKLFDMRGDPFERAGHESENYNMWRFDRAYLILPAVDYVARHLATYKDLPPRQKAGQLQPESGTGNAAAESDEQLTQSAATPASGVAFRVHALKVPTLSAVTHHGETRLF